MPTKKVLDVGNCSPDHAAITKFLTTNFDCEVEQADQAEDALAKLKSQPFDLVVVNRKLDIDYTDGIELIRRIKSEDQLKEVPVMLVTNLPEHQEAAVAIGAAPGFGKLEYDNPAAIERVRQVLG